MAHNLSTRILSNEELSFLMEKIQVLLEVKGVHIEHPEVMQILKKAGCVCDEEAGTVKFPKAIYDEALKNAAREFVLAGIDPQYDLKFPHPQGLFYTRTNTGGMTYLSEDGTYRNITLDDVAEFTRLASALPHINYWSLPSTDPVGFPAETIDVHTLNTVLRNTKKHGWIQPYEADNIKYLIELAAAVVGGKEELRKRPIVSAICCSVPRLTYKYMDMNILYECCKAGVPLQPCALPAAGANVPITSSGLALMASADVIAMIVMANIIAPGHPCVATTLLFEIDMLTTNTTQSTMATTMGRMICMQLFSEGYGIPVHTYATGTDSSILDAQAGYEAASLSHMVALSGGSVLGGAGQVETAKTISPLQLIIDNDSFGMVKNLKAGLDINDETIDWEDILNLEPTGSFVDKKHTFNHFRDAYRAKTFTRDSRTTWTEKGCKDLAARAKDQYEIIKGNYEPVVLPAEVLAAMDAIVEKADRELSGKK